MNSDKIKEHYAAFFGVEIGEVNMLKNESAITNWAISLCTNTLKEALETMHQETFNAFHDLREDKQSKRYITIDGKDANEIIRLGKIATKKQHKIYGNKQTGV